MIRRYSLRGILNILRGHKDFSSRFFAQFGPALAKRIAFDRDADQEPEVLFDDEHGPQPDGAIELTSAIVLAKSPHETVLVTVMQVPTMKVGFFTKNEDRMIGEMFARYLEKHPAVTLLARSDERVGLTVVSEYRSQGGGPFHYRSHRDVHDVFCTDIPGEVHVHMRGKMLIMPRTQLVNILEEGFPLP